MAHPQVEPSLLSQRPLVYNCTSIPCTCGFLTSSEQLQLVEDSCVVTRRLCFLSVKFCLVPQPFFRDIWFDGGLEVRYLMSEVPPRGILRPLPPILVKVEICPQPLGTSYSHTPLPLS